MIKNNSFKEIWDTLKNSKNVAMTLHAAPDGDSLGSCAAMKYVLERDFNCNVTLVSYDSLEQILMDLPYSKEVKFGTDISELNLKDYDITLFMDSSQVSGKLLNKYVPSKTDSIISIDHHDKNYYDVMINYVDSSKPSNCSVLIDLFKDSKVEFDKELSTRLLLGVCTDTLFFTVGGNAALKDASFLVSNGADYQYILDKVLYNVPLKMKKYQASLVDNLRVLDINGKTFGYSCTDIKTINDLNLSPAEIRQGPNYLSDIKECDLICTLAESNGYVKGSFRSRKGVDVLQLAKYLGGAGHKAASGFKIDSTLEDAEKKILSVLKENL